MMITAGQKISIRRTFAQPDFDRFAVLSGDDNPIHIDPGFAASTRFGQTVAHGMLLYSALCGVWGQALPGAVQLSQEMMFTSPTYAGEEVTLWLAAPGGVVEGQVEMQAGITRPSGAASLEGVTRLSLEGPGLPYLAEAGIENTGPLQPEVHSYKGLYIGQSASVERTYIMEDLAEYASLTGDTNPVYTEEKYARARGLPAPLIPGGLLGGLFSLLLGTRLPGRGTNWLKQRLSFHRPSHPGQRLAARVEVVRLRPEKELVNLHTVCMDEAGQVVCAGEALVLVRDLQI